jgi:hypothetical protein
MLGEGMCACFAGGEGGEESAYAGDFTAKGVVEGGGDAEDDAAGCGVIEGVGVDVDHWPIIKSIGKSEFIINFVDLTDDNESRM